MTHLEHSGNSVCDLKIRVGGGGTARNSEITHEI